MVPSSDWGHVMKEVTIFPHPSPPVPSVFEIKVLFCAPLGCIHIEAVRTGFFLCTPLVYNNDN